MRHTERFVGHEAELRPTRHQEPAHLTRRVNRLPLILVCESQRIEDNVLQKKAAWLYQLLHLLRIAFHVPCSLKRQYSATPAETTLQIGNRRSRQRQDVEIQLIRQPFLRGARRIGMAFRETYYGR